MKYLSLTLLLKLIVMFLVCDFTRGWWLSKEAAQSIVSEFRESEKNREEKPGRGHDRRSASPFISGDGLRQFCSPHICEESNRCRMSPEDVKNGSCIFVKSDLFDMFLTHIAPRIPGTYVLVSHNGDLSTPDGQTDAPRIGMPKYEGYSRLYNEHIKGKLLAHHGQNLW
jgi:hypothetical protein